MSTWQIFDWRVKDSFNQRRLKLTVMQSPNHMADLAKVFKFRMVHFEQMSRRAVEHFGPGELRANLFALVDRRASDTHQNQVKAPAKFER